MKTRTFTLDQIESLVRDMLPLFNQYSIVAFYGPLGIGKTTIIKEILKQSGVQEQVTSPTFGYVNTYTNADGQSFNHFDLYRITTLEQFINAGFDEYLSRSKTISFIEWPEVIAPLLSDGLFDKDVVCFFLKYDLEDISQRLISCDRW
ncbi:MAG: tRNA (adenosine(37)-N6)-threonylcarbamoyltransferase complex ATPase subunit type 1 TsaE [Candidatus Babeliales bacterium]